MVIFVIHEIINRISLYRIVIMRGMILLYQITSIFFKYFQNNMILGTFTLSFDAISVA